MSDIKLPFNDPRVASAIAGTVTITLGDYERLKARADRIGQFVPIEDVEADAKLGALVRSMPEHTALERHSNGWVYRTQRFDSSSPASTPESALRELNKETTP